MPIKYSASETVTLTINTSVDGESGVFNVAKATINPGVTSAVKINLDKTAYK